VITTALEPTRAVAARTALTLVGVTAVLLVAAERTPVPRELVTAAACVGALALIALRRPAAALGVATAVAVVVPFYDGRYVSGSLGITPMMAGCLVLLPAAATHLRDVKLVWLDGVVALLVALRAASLALNYSGRLGAAAGLVLGTALPYVVFRLFSRHADVRRLLAWVLVVASIPMSVIGLQERYGTPNPFFTLLPTGYQGDQWAHAELRGGGVRAEASFGHPIAFGMFLALVLVLAVALAMTERKGWHRLVALGAAGLALLALTATLSRGPLLVGAIGVTAWFLATLGRLHVLRVAAVLGMLVVLAFTTPVAATVERLYAASTGDTREARSAEYRLQILALARDPEQFSLLGKEAPGDEGFSVALTTRTGLKSIDSELALVFLANGALPAMALVGAGLLVTVVCFRPGLSPVDRAWAVATAAGYINLTTVALLTQQAELFWASTGVVAALAQTSRRAA
jgi:hypothetical protein